MAKYAVIENGLIINTVEAEPEFAAQQGWVDLILGFEIGDLYDGANFSKKPEVVLENKSPTKEQLLAQLQALSAQIQSLE